MEVVQGRVTQWGEAKHSIDPTSGVQRGDKFFQVLGLVHRIVMTSTAVAKISVVAVVLSE